ncbi:AAA family ATPase [Nigerium massiliense]|uniref:AAA family ATPase n=1 Tax=Nigerium massiliense TaxID=1522317 RepID=UPI00058FB6B3|nr:AAA family ATPase [Nigerium massiliense]
MLTTLAVKGYRSLRDLVVPLGPLTVVTGANGTGKSSLYRAFALLAAGASGRLIGSLARAGGLSSVLWAGPETVSGAMRRGEVEVQGTASRRAPVSLAMGFVGDDLGYLIDVGLPAPDVSTMFLRDPQVKREVVFAAPVLRPASTLVQRTARGVRVRQGRGWEDVGWRLAPHACLLDELADPVHFPEVASVRAQVLRWRFYDSFRVDAGAPARQPQVGTRTEVLSSDGADLASAVQTILESAWAEPFAEAVGGAFEGARVSVTESLGRFQLEMRQAGMLRALEASEWSDGTLRFVLLAAALLSPQPPGLLVLNEPESSLHPDALAQLARLIRQATGRTQVVVVTHSRVLVAALDGADVVAHELVKDLGETRIAGQGLIGGAAWDWGRR